jgi:hypothetical protein
MCFHWKPYTLRIAMCYFIWIGMLILSVQKLFHYLECQVFHSLQMKQQYDSEVFFPDFYFKSGAARVLALTPFTHLLYQLIALPNQLIALTP